MIEKEKTAMVKSLVDNDPNATDSVVGVYLTIAKDAILKRAYPFGIPETYEGFPCKYEMTQCKLAARYFLMRGAEGEISHNENGINRTYDSVNAEDILDEIVPFARVCG